MNLLKGNRIKGDFTLLSCFFFFFLIGWVAWQQVLAGRQPECSEVLEVVLERRRSLAAEDTKSSVTTAAGKNINLPSEETPNPTPLFDFFFFLQQDINITD